MLENPLFWLFAAPGLLLGLYAQSRIKWNYTKYSQVATASGVTGAEVARRLLDSQGLRHVRIETTPGLLSDHYDPRTKVLRLSQDVFYTPSVAAAGIAAHEAGHALQDADNYFPMQVRSFIVPLVHGHEVVGVVCATDRYEGGAFTDGDVGYVEALAETAALVLHNALQYRAADELATIDEGTQLFNRRHFNRVLPQEVVRAKRYKHDLTLAMLDVDHFKAYNDSMGHQAGDRALAIIARILKESFRESDIVVRYGGEDLRYTRSKDGRFVYVICLAWPGKELEIKNIEPQTAVIVITGHGDAVLAEQALKLDAVDVLNKPIKKEALDAALKKAEKKISDHQQSRGYEQGSRKGPGPRSAGDR